MAKRGFLAVTALLATTVVNAIAAPAKAALSLGYQASFAGTTGLLPSAASGTLL